MKKLLSVLLIIALSSFLFACSKKSAGPSPTESDRDFEVTMKAHIYRRSFGYYPEPDWTEDFEFEDLHEGDQIKWNQLNLLMFRSDEVAIEIVSIDDDGITVSTDQGTEVVKYDDMQKVLKNNEFSDQFFNAGESYIIFTKGS
ncbi:MAG: hypothetical protein J6U54_05070 [Clostridiales bacterium]|nr:hypothetical protein [Clostridiales bacterium]